MNTRPLFERLVRRVGLLPRLALVALGAAILVSLMLGIGYYSQSRTFSEMQRLLALASSQVSPEGQTALENLQRGLDAAQTATTGQIVAISALAFGLFIAGGIVAYALAASIIRPVAEIRQAMDTAVKDGFRFDETIFSPAAQAGLAAGFEKKRSPTRALLSEAVFQDDQDEVSQLAFSTRQLFEKVDTSVESLERKIRDRMAQVNQRAANLLVLGDVIHEIVTEDERTTLDQKLVRAVDLIANKFGYYQVGVFLLDLDQRMLILRAGSGEIGRSLRERVYAVRIGETSLVGYTATTGESRVVNDVTTDFLYQKEALLARTRSEAVFPMRVGREVIGVLDVQHSEVQSFDAEREAILQILADQLAVVVENSRLSATLQQSEAETQTMYQRYIEQSWSMKRVGSNATGFEFDRMEITPVERSLAPSLLDELNKGQPILVEVDAFNSGLYGLPPGSTALLAPILMYNRLVGVIGLESDVTQNQLVAPNSAEGSTLTGRIGGLKWGREQVEVIQSLTAQIALAMDNARLLEESQQRATQLRLLQEVTSAAASHTEMGELLDHVTQTLRAGLDIPYCGAILFDGEQQFGQVSAGSSLDPGSIFNSLCNFKWPVEGHLALEQLIRTGRSLLVTEPGVNPLTKSIHWILKQVGTTNLLLVPLIYKTQVIGLFDLHFVEFRQELANENNRKEYLRLFDQISLQISSAVEVARSFEEAENRAVRERKVGEVVRHIRETLDIQTILRTAADEIRGAFHLPEVTVRLLTELPAGISGAGPASLTDKESDDQSGANGHE